MTLDADGQTCMTNSRSILDIRLVLFNRTQPEERTKQLLLLWWCSVLLLGTVACPRDLQFSMFCY